MKTLHKIQQDAKIRADSKKLFPILNGKDWYRLTINTNTTVIYNTTTTNTTI